jgi:hypothetical protein
LEKVKIEISTEVIYFLNNLVLLLFKKEYFGFEEYAQLYVQKIYDFIEFEMITFPYKTTPQTLKKRGSNYAFYKANNRTTWYIFFEKQENRMLITHKTNNHIQELNELF